MPAAYNYEHLEMDCSSWRESYRSYGENGLFLSDRSPGDLSVKGWLMFQHSKG
jgi:hypothetical protein